MRFAGHAFVDWDDTIAENIRYFREVEEANSNLIARLTGFPQAEVLHRGEELDVATVRRLGLVRNSMALAWVECYREFAGRADLTPDPDTEAGIARACQMPYEVKQGLLPGAAETLEWLFRSGFEVTIWTGGDPEVQGRKIRDSGLQHLVHRQQIALNKTPERLLEALGEREIDRSFVVGNSIHSDVLPALTVGMTAYHLPVETWAFDRAQLDPGHPLYQRVERISDLPEALARRFRLAV